jgi:hypothetical protein
MLDHGSDRIHGVKVIPYKNGWTLTNMGRTRNLDGVTQPQDPHEEDCGEICTGPTGTPNPHAWINAFTLLKPRVIGS